MKDLLPNNQNPKKLLKIKENKINNSNSTQ